MRRRAISSHLRYRSRGRQAIAEPRPARQPSAARGPVEKRSKQRDVAHLASPAALEHDAVEVNIWIIASAALTARSSRLARHRAPRTTNLPARPPVLRNETELHVDSFAK